MKKGSFYGLLVLSVLASTGFSDTFRQKETGQTFDGFVTQKTTGGMTRVYNSNEKKFVAVDLLAYEVTRNEKGRRETVVLVPITSPETLMSQTVAEQIAKSIVEASNTGPLAILLEIDSPGGRGEYMKIIASAAAQTTNCPVAAYIPGGAYGGAFSSAAVIAMACDKIFIAPTASMGAVGPMITGGGASSMDYAGFISTYSPSTLVTFSTYVTALAQQNKRPPVLARGLIDKKLSIIEVTNINGSHDFIEKDQRQPTQTIVRTLASGMTDYQPAAEDEKSTGAVDVAGSVLNLTAEEAVRTGMADEIAASRKDVLVAMNIPTAQYVSAQGIDTTIKKFTAAKRNIASSLAQIDRLEQQAQTLDTDLQRVQGQLRTGTQTREIDRSNPTAERRVYRDTDNFNNQYPESRYNTYNQGRSARYPASTRERVTTTEPLQSPVTIANQLAVVLREVIGEYRRTISLADRWPGGLPQEVTAAKLRSNLDSATAQLNNLYRMNTNMGTNMNNMNTTPGPGRGTAGGY
ncbi:MAG: hypothetical protein LLF76_08570 [Planctomycetaceae bacterium]|nr:hypothetical protein [Planctomycetaceae bacterium]